MTRLLAALLFSSSLFPALAQAVQVDGAWARATAPGQMAGGAYMTLTSDTAARVVGVSTPVAGESAVHEMSMEGTTMKMHPVEGGLVLPAGKPVELKPGGYHVMMMELKQPLKAGDRVPVTLRIEGADRKVVEQTVSVEVRDAPPTKH